VTKRLRDTKGTGKWDAVYYFEDNQLVREERDTKNTGVLDFRTIYDKGQIVAQEADTNGDRRVDVWVNFQNGERTEQLEDQNYQGKITARYIFKGGQVIAQETLESVEPPRVSKPFNTIEEELKSALDAATALQSPASKTVSGLVLDRQIK
jgi:hypothetical protein